MKCKAYLIIFFVYIALSGCKSKSKIQDETKENRISDQTIKLIPFDTVSLAIDTTTSNFYPDFQFRVLNARRVLTIYNDYSHRLQLYDLTNNENFLNIILEKEGQDAIQPLGGFHMHSLDSVFLFTQNTPNSIFLVDSLGKIRNTFKVDDKLGRSSTYEVSVGDYFEPSYDPNTNLLTFWISPWIDQETIEYYRFPLAVDYNIKDKRIVRNYGHYPDFFKGDDIYFLRSDLQRLLTDEFDIHYFDVSHELYLYDLTDKKLAKTVFAKSQYLPYRIESSTKKGEDQLPLQQQRNYNITNGRYDRLLQDTVNKFYYRFVRHPQELLALDGLMNGKLSNEVSILILDQEFRVAGEELLSANVFMDDFCFVVDGVLWVNINHPDSPLNEENSLKFILFKPSKQ